MAKVIQFPACASQGHAFCAAVLRRAHILSLASSNHPAHPKPPVTKSAAVVPLRGAATSPSLTGTTVATPNTDGGDDV